MTLKLVAPLAIVALFLFSCSPKEKDKTTVEPEKPSNTFLLLGTWDMLFSADDDNENGQLDEEEKVFPEEGDEKMSLTFRSDGTGETVWTFEDNGIPGEEKEKFQWSFQNNETQLRIIGEYNVDSFETYYDTSVLDILSLSEVSATLLYQYSYFNGVDSVTDLSWMVLGKQL